MYLSVSQTALKSSICIGTVGLPIACCCLCWSYLFPGQVSSCSHNLDQALRAVSAASECIAFAVLLQELQSNAAHARD